MTKQEKKRREEEKIRRANFITSLVAGIVLLGVLVGVVFGVVSCVEKRKPVYVEMTVEGVETKTVDVPVEPEEGSEQPATTKKETVEETFSGKIVMKLDPKVAPLSVANFVKLVKDHYYDGLTFHRIMNNFMIQGGNGGIEKPAATIKGEFASNGWNENTLSHVRGTVSMARTGEKDSASSQFFICNADAKHLDGDYAAFGTVVEGMELVDRITAAYAGKATDGDGGGFGEDVKLPVIVSAVVLKNYKNK